MKELLERKNKLQNDIEDLIKQFVKDVDNHELVINIAVETSFLDRGVRSEKQFYMREVKVTVEI